MIWPFRREKKRKAPAVTITVERNGLDEAYTLLQKKYPILDRHFELTEQLRNTYTPSSEVAVEKGVRLCREMVKISDKVRTAFEDQQRNQEKASKMLGWERPRQQGLPSHAGYKQLAIIFEKRNEFEEAIKIARQAQAQGWNGDWEKRITRCEARITKREAKS